MTLTIYDPGGGGGGWGAGFKSPPSLCVGDFSQKNILIGGHDLAVSGVSKKKVHMIFIIFREFNTMLEIVDS